MKQARLVENQTSGKIKEPLQTKTPARKKQKFSHQQAKSTWLTPRKPDETQEQETGDGADGGDGGDGGDYKRQHSLVFEQNEEFERFLKSILESDGHDLTGCKLLALRYLLAGSPYKGTHLKGYKTL